VIIAILAALAGSGSGGWWWWHAHRKPTRTCPKCDGNKYVPVWSPTGAERYRKCPKCEATGRVLKWQARRALKHGGRTA
jgi:hypothetical protein